MKKYLQNKFDKQHAVYEVDYSAMTFRLVAMNPSGADRLPDIRGKFKAGQFSPEIFREVGAPK